MQRRGGPSIMLAIGLPHPNGGDEDALDRERNGNNGGDSDIAIEAICSIVHTLHQEGPSAIKKLRAFTDALGDMCQAYMDRDSQGLEDAAHDAATALRNLIGED